MSEEAYLFSLLKMGDGLTRKSLKDDTMDGASDGNFTASLPTAWYQEISN